MKCAECKNESTVLIEDEDGIITPLCDVHDRERLEREERE